MIKLFFNDSVENDDGIDGEELYPIFFPDEASNAARLIIDCHWFVWIFLTFILVFVFIMFIFIINDSSNNIKKNINSPESLYWRYLHFRGSKIIHLSRVELIWTILPFVYSFW